MTRKLFVILFLAVFASVPASASKVSSNKKIIAGWLENIYIPSLEAGFKAKLDSGAKTSSIDAEIIDVRESTSEDEKLGRIIFTITDSEGKKKTLERKIMRWVKIKKKSTTSGFVRRPVIVMEYCIAGKLIEDEVNLANRQHFNYPVLIGRNMLSQAGLVVDTSKTYTRKPNCKEDAEEALPAKKTKKKAPESATQEKERLEQEMKAPLPPKSETEKPGSESDLKASAGDDEGNDDEDYEEDEDEEEE